MRFKRWGVLAVALSCGCRSQGGSNDAMQSVLVGEAALAASALINGKIAFVSTRDGTTEIYSMNSDGTGAVRLTNDTAYNAAPSWSADGTKLVFESSPGIAVMNADGSNFTQLTTDFHDISPAFSPDGTKIAFTSSFELYVMNADGTGRTSLNTGGHAWGGPAWSPDGTKLAYNCSNPAGIHLINPDGTGDTQLTFEDFMTSVHSKPAWSPDGSKIVFNSQRVDGFELWVVNADGSSETRLTGAPEIVYKGGQQWSPDGTKIIFHGTDATFIDSDLFVMNADGSGIAMLPDPNEWSDGSPSWQPVNTDLDGDGIPNEQDVEAAQQAIADLPAGAFKGGDPGHAGAMTKALDDIEALIAAGKIDTALRRLRSLREKVDGCGTRADSTDWIVDCTAQSEIRALLDALIAALS